LFLVGECEGNTPHGWPAGELASLAV
jgi:hypothetical protein